MARVRNVKKMLHTFFHVEICSARFIGGNCKCKEVR